MSNGFGESLGTGLGAGLSRLGELLMMLAQMKETRKFREEEGGREQKRIDISGRQAAAAEQANVEDRRYREQQLRLARGRAFTDPLAEIGIHVDPTAAEEATSGRSVPPVAALGSPGASAAASGAALAAEQGALPQRRADLMQRGSAALEQAYKAPGSVTQFEGGGGFAIRPPIQRTESVSIQDQALRRATMLQDAYNDFLKARTAHGKLKLDEYRARNRYGDPSFMSPDEQRTDDLVTMRAEKEFEASWQLHPALQQALGVDSRYPLVDARPGRTPPPEDTGDPRNRYRRYR